MRQQVGTQADEILKFYPTSTQAEAAESQKAFARDMAVISMSEWALKRGKTGKTNVYTYLFTHPQPGATKERYQTFHSSELPYIFDNLQHAPRPWTAEDEKIAETMSSLLDELHRYGRSQWEGIGNVANIQRNTGRDDGIGRHDGATTHYKPGETRGAEEVVAGNTALNIASQSELHTKQDCPKSGTWTMRKTALFTFLPLLVVQHILIAQTTGGQQLRLWYEKPASAFESDANRIGENDAEWIRALPVGNGFLGAMVFGGVNRETLQLNEKSLWSGSPDDNNNPEAAESLGKIRQLLFEKRYREANELTERTQVCKGVGSGRGSGANAPYGSYQSLGDLLLDFGKNTPYGHYVRELDLNCGVARISYVQEGISYQREIFASYPDRALVMHLTASVKGALSFRAALTRPERFATVTDHGSLMMYGTLENGKGGDGMHYAARLRAVTSGGRVVYSDSVITIRGADEVVLLFTASTNYKQDYPRFIGDDPKSTTLDQLNQAASRPYATLLKNHEDDYAALFGKVSLNLSGECAGHNSDRRTFEEPADESRRPSFAGTLLPIWPLLVDLLFPKGFTAGQFAGDLVEQDPGTLELRLSHEHQPADELLARR